MPIPAIVGAAIISAGAGVGATVYGAKAAGSNARRAQAAEERSIDKQLAATERANTDALDWEKDVENRRRSEWDQQQADEHAQWDWYQQALEPYRRASGGALGSLSQMVQQLGGAGFAPGAPTAPPSAPAGPPAGWSPSSMVRTADATKSSFRPAPFAVRSPASSTMPVGGVPTAILQAGQTIADLVKNLPPSARRILEHAGVGEDI